jgi:hypothetical protein
MARQRQDWAPQRTLLLYLYRLKREPRNWKPFLRKMGGRIPFSWRRKHPKIFQIWKYCCIRQQPELPKRKWGAMPPAHVAAAKSIRSAVKLKRFRSSQHQIRPLMTAPSVRRDPIRSRKGKRRPVVWPFGITGHPPCPIERPVAPGRISIPPLETDLYPIFTLQFENHRYLPKQAAHLQHLLNLGHGQMAVIERTSRPCR